MDSNLKDQSFLHQNIKDSANLQFSHSFSASQLDLIFSKSAERSYTFKGEKLKLRRSTDESIYSCEIEIDFLPIDKSKWDDLNAYFNALASKDEDDIEFYGTQVTDEQIEEFKKHEGIYEQYVLEKIKGDLDSGNFFVIRNINNVDVFIETYL